ncbi:hypothetical protein EMIT0P2_10011 [Pseudomonas sp. IT-P2]
MGVGNTVVVQPLEINQGVRSFFPEKGASDKPVQKIHTVNFPDALWFVFYPTVFKRKKQ